MNAILPTALAEKVMQSVVSVPPSVSTLLTNCRLGPTLIFLHVYRVWWPWLAGDWKSRSFVKVNTNMREAYTGIYCGVLWLLIDGRSSRFPLRRYQLRAGAEECGAAEASGSDEIQRVTRSVWPRSSIDGSFSTVTVVFMNNHEVNGAATGARRK